jgi:pimeloyl-ACP methyl ester carboxylesterase
MASLVLIHGGSTSGRYWDRLRPLLAPRHLAPDLPGRGARPADLMTLTVTNCVDSLLADIHAADLEPALVLMAHSSGGLVIPGLTRALGDRVQHIVYSSASIPPEGGNGLDCMKPRHAEGCRKALEAARAAGRTITTLDGPEPSREQASTQYGGDPLSDALVEYVLAPERRCPDSFNVYFEALTWGGVAHDLPATYIRNLRDRAVPLALQDTMIARSPGPLETHDFDGGHVPSVTEPERVADLLNGLSGS